MQPIRLSEYQRIREMVSFWWTSGGFTTLPCKDTWNLVLVHLRKIPRSAGRKFRFSHQLYSKMHGFKYEFSKFFWRGAHWASSPNPLSLLNLRLRRRFSGALRPRFVLHTQFTPPTWSGCLLHNPAQNRCSSGFGSWTHLFHFLHLPHSICHQPVQCWSAAICGWYPSFHLLIKR